MPITPSASFALQWTRTRKSRAQHPAHGPYVSPGARANTGASPTASTAALSLSTSRPTTTSAPRKCSASASNTATNSKALLARTLQFLGFVDIRRIPFNSRQKQDANRFRTALSVPSRTTAVNQTDKPNRTAEVLRAPSRPFADHRRSVRGSPPSTKPTNPSEPQNESSRPFADHRR